MLVPGTPTIRIGTRVRARRPRAALRWDNRTKAKIESAKMMREPIRQRDAQHRRRLFFLFAWTSPYKGYR
jgi:hypothetical protein